MPPTVVARGKSRPAYWRRMERERHVADNGDSLLVCAPATLTAFPNVVCQLVAVADGLGGEGNDDLASQAAVSALDHTFRAELPESLTISPPDAWLREAFVRANQKVCDERQARRIDGMFTTLTAALLVTRADGTVALYPGNIGDSRLYLWRDGELYPLSRDDGASGYVTRVIGDPNLFHTSFLRYATTVARTPDIQHRVRAALEAALDIHLHAVHGTELAEYAELFQNVLEGVFPLDMLANVNLESSYLIDRLGLERFHTLLELLIPTYDALVSELAPIPLLPGDRLLLCSDGISNAFSESFLCDALSARSPHQPPAEVLDNILQFLLEAPGRVDDDRTGVIVHVG